MPSWMQKLNISSAMSKIKTGKVSHPDKIKSFSLSYLDNIYSDISKEVGSDFFQKNGEELIYKKANAFLDTLKYPFAQMPLEILNSFANRFHIERLQNSKILTNFNNSLESKKYERAMRGLLQNGDNIINKVIKEENIKSEDVKDFLIPNIFNPNGFEKESTKVADEFYKLFDENLACGKAKYNTTHERTIVKGVSGGTAALVMGADFYNKSIKNGKTDEEAKEEAKSKRNQELIETGQEALAQYFTLGAFSGFTNSHTYAAPLINTGLSTLFRITSRLSTGRPLTRIEPPENKSSQLSKFLTINGFANSIMNKEPIKNEEVTLQNNKTSDKDKKHILSFKNIVLACLASIGIGFASKTKGAKYIKDVVMDFKPVKKVSEMIRNATVGELWLDEKEINSFKNILEKCRFNNTQKYYNKKFKQLVKKSKNGKIFIGEYEKMSKVPLLNIEVSNKELLMLPLAPFRIAKEILGYPYKLVNSALQGLGIVKKPNNKLKNEINMVNTYLDFKKQAAKFNNDIQSTEFIEHYTKHMKDNRLTALNKETKSNVNNCDIGKLTALLGVFSSIYFSTTDDYNSTLKQTGDVEKANKDARLRGINKIIRTSVQCVFLSLNNLFKVSYSKSLIGAAAITAACTVLTDSVSRILSGMPFKKMNKEQLEAYNKDKKEGMLKGYYNALDKITD